MARETKLYAPHLRSHEVRTSLSDDCLLELVATAYEAAVEDEKWSSFLTQACLSLGASAGSFHNRDFSQHGLGDFNHLGWDPEKLDQYENFFHACCPYRENIPKAVVGKAISITDIIELKEYTETLYYEDFLKPQDIHHTCFMNLQTTSKSMWTFDLYRPAHREGFSAEEREFVEALSNHVRRAILISDSLKAGSQKVDTYLEVIERSPVPILLLNRSGRVDFMNEASKFVLAEQDGISIQNGRLVLAAPDASRKFRSILSKFASGGAPDDSEETVEAERPSLKPSYVLNISFARIGTETSNGGNDFAVVFVNVPPTMPENIEDRLIAKFELTPAEARLANGLMSGRTLQSLAKDFGVSYGTVRTQLKRIFEKTDTHAQAELIAKVLSAVRTYWPT